MALKRSLLALFLIGVAVGTTLLGFWQLERRAWKLRLIAAVESRIHTVPVPAPGPAEWSRVTAERDAYRRVMVTGRFSNERETLVYAVTGRGEGHWLMTPLRTDAGWTVLINRGFVPQDAQPNRPSAVTTVTGLMRMTEPRGVFLRSNDPDAGRWYSRDVPAIAAARHLREVAPYFIDASATPNPAGYPIGGLTVVNFRNAHLSYAITWFALAALSTWGAVRVLRDR